jgi:hypothetical protein
VNFKRTGVLLVATLSVLPLFGCSHKDDTGSDAPSNSTYNDSPDFKGKSTRPQAAHGSQSANDGKQTDTSTLPQNSSSH